jgi:hypothetical protein
MNPTMATTPTMARRFAVLAIAIVALLTMAAAPANAAIITVSQGDDYASVQYLSNADQVDVCDREADGHGVYVKVVLDDGYDQFGDANGSASPCSSRTYARRQVDSIQVCEAVTGPDYCSRRAG